MGCVPRAGLRVDVAVRLALPMLKSIKDSQRAPATVAGCCVEGLSVLIFEPDYT